MADDFASRFADAKIADFEARFTKAEKVEAKAPEKKGPFGLPNVRTPLDVILNPQGIPQHMLSLAATAALTGGAGSLAKAGAVKLGLPELAVKVAPAIGRIAASGGLGAAEAFNRGEGLSGMERTAALDALIAGATEGVLGSSGRLSKAERDVIKGNKRGAEQATAAQARAKEATAASAARAQEATAKEDIKATTKNKELEKVFQWAQEQPEKAIQAIAPRVGQFEFLNVPSISRTPLTLPEIAEKIKTLRGVDYAEARKEIISELNRLSGTGVRRDIAELHPAGKSFEQRTSTRLFEPEPIQPRPTATKARVSAPPQGFTPEPMPKTLRGYLTRENAPRATADALLTQPGPGDLPLGLVGGMLAPEYLGDYARRALQVITPH